MEKVTLYSKDAKGKIRMWSVWHDDDYIYMSSGLKGGEEIEKSERVSFGMAGRTKLQQIELRMNSRINKKIDSGMVYTVEEAQNEIRTNSLGFLKPAKCMRWDQEYKNVTYDETWVQPKLNGHHCSIINKDGELIAYSSNGKLIKSIDHILESMKIPEGMTIEGELYIHGMPLQKIGSLVKKNQEDSKKLIFNCYDVAIDKCYSHRFSILENLDLGQGAILLETAYLRGQFNIEPILAAYLKRGYEGAVVRLAGHPHKAGAKSKGMLKVKPMHFDAFKIDDEFLVVNISGSKDGWGILNCETEEGVPFDVSCFGPMKYKKYVYDNRDKFIGKHIRVEYSEFTEDKKPFHPVAIEWREKFDE